MDAVEAEGVPDQDYTMVVLVAKLACALAHEREARKALGVAVDELYDRVEALEAPPEYHTPVRGWSLPAGARVLLLSPRLWPGRGAYGL